MRKETEKPDLYQTITDQIVAAIEAGAGPYRMPWHPTGDQLFTPINAATRRPYRGVNILTLWLLAARHGYPTGEWATYRQWQALGAQVRTGEKAALVIYWKVTERRELAPAAEPVEAAADEESAPRSRFLLRSFFVFNAAQVDGYTAPEIPVLAESERVETAERFFAALSADIRHGGPEASYCPATDHIQMPPFSTFRDSGAYYATLAHEMIHWTGARARLNRDLSLRFGGAAYAMEELVAGLGAAFLCATLGLFPTARPEYAAYVADWLRVLKNDKRALFTAAAKAQQAVDWLTAAAAASPQ